MNEKVFKEKLVEIYSIVHQYSYNLLSDLKPDVYSWTPLNTKGRSIVSYFRHLVNSEIYWLYAIKKHDIPYIMKDSTFEDMINKYKEMEKLYVGLLHEANNNDLKILETKYLDKNNGINMEIVQQGTLAWTVLRISLHALGHISQMTYILYALGVRGKEHPDYNWWNLTEKIISLGELANN